MGTEPKDKSDATKAEMPWHKLTVETNEGSTAANSTAQFIQTLGKAYADAGTPDGVEVWGLASHSARHIYILSPPAYALLPIAALRRYGMLEAFEKMPSTTGYNRIPL
jgi:hypothetical protein